MIIITIIIIIGIIVVFVVVIVLIISICIFIFVIIIIVIIISIVVIVVIVIISIIIVVVFIIALVIVIIVIVIFIVVHVTYYYYMTFIPSCLMIWLVALVNSLQCVHERSHGRTQQMPSSGLTWLMLGQHLSPRDVILKEAKWGKGVGSRTVVSLCMRVHVADPSCYIIKYELLAHNPCSPAAVRRLRSCRVSLYITYVCCVLFVGQGG